MRRLLQPAQLAALLVILAGCTAGLPGDTTNTAPSTGVGPAPDPTGSVAFYLSDQPNAISDFEHLNVTVTQVGFHPKGDDNETDDNATAAANETADSEFGGWITEPVDNRTVDLTTLVGANATQIAGVDLPTGEYNGVFVWVSAVNGTLTDGSHVEVKLPSERLRLNTHFTVAENESVDFVFDIAVHETGTGRYVLRPVISESGTEVPIEPVEDDDGPPVNETDVAEGGLENAGNESRGQGNDNGQGQGQDD